MNKINKITVATVCAAGLTFSGASLAKGLVLLPVSKDGYQPEAAVSLIAGTMEPSRDNMDSSSILGAELSFRCVLLQVGDNQLRQQLSFTTWDKNNLTLQNLEINAHYQIPVAQDLKVGVGPGVGIVMTDAAGTDNPTFFGAQLGGSLHYTGMAPFFTGAEARYQITNKDKFTSAGEEDNMNNWRMAVKLGYMF
jgi:hypothetical protein